MKRRGRKSLSQMPAPKRERISGSSVNKKGSAKSKTSGKSISFSVTLTNTIKSKVSNYNKKNPSRKITLSVAKSVVRRGMGAYSLSHRPTIRAGKPNSRTAWGLARLSAFMRKKSGSKTANGAVRSKEIKKSYTQDNDLM
jgi:hypothetical protein